MCRSCRDPLCRRLKPQVQSWRDLGIEGVNITAGDITGIIAGTNAGRISRCYTIGTVSGGEKIGGLVGTNEAGSTIENCYSRAAVSGTDYLSGLVGSNSGTVTTSYAASTVTDSVLNNYLQFNGGNLNPASNVYTSGGYISIPDNPAYKGNAFTLEAWFQFDGAGSAFIISKGGTNVEDTEWFEIHTNGNGLRFIPIPNKNIYSEGYSGDSWIDAKNVLQPGWFHVAAVYWYEEDEDKGYAQIYVNGEAQELYQANNLTDSVGTIATIARTTNHLEKAKNHFPINIGRRGDGSYYFNGKIADVRFWDIARDGDDIKADMNKKLSGTETGLVGYWMLNDDLGDTASDGKKVDDATVNDNKGTIHGTVTQIKGAGATDKGALVGRNTGTVERCFYDSQLYGVSTDTNGTAKFTVEMQERSTFTGTATANDWNFTTIWGIADTGEYPDFWTQEATPNAIFTATGDSTGTLSNVTSGMRYKVGNGVWKDISSGADLVLTQLSAGTILVMKPGNETTTLDSDAQTINVTKAETSSLSVTQPNTINGKGSIPMTNLHEYKLSSATAWTAASGTANLEPGVYSVRVKANGAELASASQSITITAFVPNRDGIASSQTTANVPVLIDGERYNIGMAQTSGGVTTVTVDQTALQNQLDIAKETVIVPIVPAGNADTATAQLTVENVDKMAEKGMTLSVAVNHISYHIPAVAIDTAALMRELNATDPTEVPVNVTIKELSADDVTLENGKLLLLPVSFAVTVSYGDKSAEVRVFDKFVHRVIEIPNGVDPGKITTAVAVENGKQRHVPTEVFQKDGSWYACINSLTNSTYALIFNGASFTDDDGKWFEPVVSEMASRGIINGRSGSIFDGNASITRAEFAAIIIRALGLPENGDASSFSDVARPAWYYGAVGKAYEYGLVDGCGQGIFDPTANITRQEAMAMIHRAAAICEFTGSIGSLAAFSDVSTISDWAKIDAAWNVGSGLIQGNSYGEINGKDNITRGETATIVLRLFQKSGLMDVRTQV